VAHTLSSLGVTMGHFSPRQLISLNSDCVVVLCSRIWSNITANLCHSPTHSPWTICVPLYQVCTTCTTCTCIQHAHTCTQHVHAYNMHIHAYNMYMYMGTTCTHAYSMYMYTCAQHVWSCVQYVQHVHVLMYMCTTYTCVYNRYLTHVCTCIV